MISHIRQSFAYVLLILGIASCVHAQTVPSKKPGATVSGKVTVKGKGVSGIAVGLVDSSRQARLKAVTDEQGNYRIVNVPPGSYQVIASARAFVHSGSQGRANYLLISKDETIENIDFNFIRGGVITGRVADSDGQPLIEATVSVEPVEIGREVYFIHSDARTDDRGIYRIFGLPPGKYRVACGDGFLNMRGSAYRKTFHPASEVHSEATIVEVTEGGEVSGVDITPGRPFSKYSVRGRIVDAETGQPLPNANYMLEGYREGGGGGAIDFGAKTNSNGEFKWELLTPGKYGIVLQPPHDGDWQPSSVKFEIVDQDVTGLLLKAFKGASISGVIVLEGADDKSVKPSLSQARLGAYVSNEHSTRMTNRVASINPDGNFRVSGLQPGLVNFSFYGEDRLRIARIERDGLIYNRGVEIKEREQLTGLRIVVSHGNAALSGVVKVENGTLPKNAQVYIALKKVSEEVGALVAGFDGAQVDARGRFLLEGLIPGMYEVTASVLLGNPRGEVGRTKQQVVLVSGTVTNVTLTVNLNSITDRP